MNPNEPQNEPVADVRSCYEHEGWFDKDEQGWCSTQVEIEQTGRRVKVRVFHDANGILRSDVTREGTVGPTSGDVVAIVLDDGARMLRFDLRSRRLVELP